MLGDRLRFYRARMGYTQQDMATLLGIGYEGYKEYERPEPAIPPLAVGIAYGERMLVGIGFLSGEETIEFWSRSILKPMRAELRRRIANKTAWQQMSADERMCNLLRETYAIDSKRFDIQILSGVARLVRKSEDACRLMQQIIEQGSVLKLPDLTLARLAEFWGIRTTWLTSGAGSPVVTDTAPFQSVVNYIEEKEYTLEFLMHHADIFDSMLEVWKRDQKERNSE